MKNRYEIRGDVAVIFLNRKDGSQLECLIDVADLPLAQLPNHTWCAAWKDGPKTFYARAYLRGGGRRRVADLHRMVTGCPAGMEVDHINHNGLDNRRSVNLRVVTHMVNQNNRRGPASNGSSGYRGVSYLKNIGRWRACVIVANRQRYLGSFLTAEEASTVVQEALRTGDYMRKHGRKIKRTYRAD